MRERTQDVLVDEDAERAVVGTLLLNGGRGEEVGELSPDDFGCPRPALAMWAICELGRRQAPVNLLAVSQALKDVGKLAEAGGPSELMGYDKHVTDMLGYGEGFATQVQRVRDLAHRRRLRAEAQRQLERIVDLSRPVSELALEAAARLTEMGSNGGTRVETADVFLERSVLRVEAAQKGQAQEKYIKTGVEPWDRFIGGLARRRVTVLAAHPSVGKSGLMNSMALSLAKGSASYQPERVYFGHIEDEGESFSDRHLAEHSGLSLRELGSAGLSREALERVYEAQAQLHNAMRLIRLDDQRGLNVRQFVARARHYVRSEGVRVVLVDHALQLIQDPQKLNEKMWVVMQTLADFAHQDNVAVLLALHLTDPEEKKTQDARYVRPTIQMMAGGRMVDRVARTIVGMRLCPPPKAPAARGKQPQPPKNLDEQALEKWQAEQRRSEAKYWTEVSQWKERCALHERRVLLSAIKANEGRSGFEFWMERIEHAGLFHKDRGGSKEGELGYTPAPAAGDAPQAE